MSPTSFEKLSQNHKRRKIRESLFTLWLINADVPSIWRILLLPLGQRSHLKKSLINVCLIRDKQGCIWQKVDISQTVFHRSNIKERPTSISDAKKRSWTNIFECIIKAAWINNSCISVFKTVYDLRVGVVIIIYSIEFCYCDDPLCCCVSIASPSLCCSVRKKRWMMKVANDGHKNCCWLDLGEDHRAHPRAEKKPTWPKV